MQTHHYTVEKKASTDIGFLQLQIYVDFLTNFLADETSETKGTVKDDLVLHPYFTPDISEWISGLSHRCLKEEIM